MDTTTEPAPRRIWDLEILSETERTQVEEWVRPYFDPTEIAADGACVRELPDGTLRLHANAFVINGDGSKSLSFNGDGYCKTPLTLLVPTPPPVAPVHDDYAKAVSAHRCAHV